MVITARTRNAVTAQAVQGFESLRFRQCRLGLESHKKRFDKISQAFFLCSFCSRRLISFALGVRNDVAFRCTTLTAEGHGRTNPFASATKIALARALFVSSKEIRLHLCHRQHCCRTLCCMLRFACNWKNKHECFRFAFLPSLADCLAGACISHAPAKMPFEVFFVVDINRVSSLSSKQLQIMYYPTCKKY